MEKTFQKNSLEDLLNYLKISRGFDFTGYKRSSLARRIDKRMQMINISRHAEYIDYLAVHPEEFTQLFNMILINVTDFYRDPRVWDFISEHIIPEILASHTADEPIRVWSVGCASGEEPYTIAILLAEAIGVKNFTARVKIYATDLDEEALNKARAAFYTHREVENVPAGLLEKYFELNGGGYLFNKELRRSVIFGRHNVIHDAPISRIDLLICRNLLMYLNNETQSQALSRLHFAIKDGGFLVLGKAEMLLSYSSLFTAVDIKSRIFRSAAKPSFRDRLQLMAANVGEESTTRLANQFQLQETGFLSCPVPQIIVDSTGALALANECAQRQFNITPADLGRPFQDVQLSYRPTELRASIDRVYSEYVTIAINHIGWLDGSGIRRYLNIVLTPLRNNGNGIIAVLITFIDTTEMVDLLDKLEHTNLELETALSELQSSNEELETTNEELQSTIEELETTNEELQSSNEEMETMNEELQSTNEELETISEESRNQSDELFRVNRLLDAIITSLRGGIIVADREDRILTWNEKSEDLWGLRSDEVEGKNLFDLDIGLPTMQLKPFTREILYGNTDRVETTLQAVNRRGKAISCRISAFPLYLKDREVHGYILISEDTPS